jgi:hypothetical protein
MPTFSLDAIQQRIAKQNSELRALRQELETRQNRLRSLAHRKEELQAKLRQIEAEMVAVAGGTKVSKAAAPKTALKKPISASSSTPKSEPPSLHSLLVAALQSAGGPLTAKQLVGEVRPTRFQDRECELHQDDRIKVVGLEKARHRPPSGWTAGLLTCPWSQWIGPEARRSSSRIQKAGGEGGGKAESRQSRSQTGTC